MSHTRAGGPVVLVHGGLYEDMDASRFWGETGIAAGIRAHGYTVQGPNRPRRPVSWEEERDSLITFVTKHMVPPVGIVAASNGCSAALRAVVDRPGIARRLVLCWPATAGDPKIDASTRAGIVASVGGRIADRLLAGETIRGLLDRELESIGIPVTIVPSEPEDPLHQPPTVERLVRLLPEVHLGPAAPPALRPDFTPHRSSFLAAVVAALT